MSFLSIAFLMALPLAAAPLLLHFFDRRRNAVIHWGAMQFLIEASTRKTSARRLKQWLLLLLRCLAIAALIFALARPLIPAGYLGSRGEGETVFVVDNSMSMLRETDSGTMIQQAVRRGQEMLSDLSRTEEVRILTTAPYPVWASAGTVRSDSRNRQWIASQLDQLNATEGRSDLLAALFTAVQAEHKPSLSSRRIVLLTDGQSADWRLEDRAGWNRLHDVLNESPVRTEIEIVRLDQASQAASKGNIGVDEISIDRLMVGVGQPVTAIATLHNYDAAASQTSQLVWQVDGESKREQAIDPIEGEQTAQANWTHTFDAPGTYQLRCQIEHDDDLPPDNQSTLVVQVVQSVPIVIVESAFELAEMQQDSYFIQAALGWIDGRPLDESSIYVPTLVSPDELATTDLTEQRVVVIPNLTRMSDDGIEKLTEFVAEGGGLWVGLGPRTDVDRFNQQWFAEASGLAPLRIDRIVDSAPVELTGQGFAEQGFAEEMDTAPADGRQLRIDPFRSEHPATRQLADDQQLDLSDAMVDRYFQFVLGEDPSAVSVLLRLNNGQPLVAENFIGRGRVLVQAIPLRLQWSDLARTQSFVVMVRDWIDYLAQPRATQFNLDPGQPIVMRLADATANGSEAGTGTEAPTALLRTPQGDAVELAAQRRDDAFVFQSSRTRLPGEYQLEIGLSDRPIPFHVRRSAEESNLERLNSDAWQQIAAATTANPSPESMSARASSQSDPVWPYLLLGLIGLIACELVLAGILSRERFGSAGIPEYSDMDSPMVPPAADPGDTNLHSAATPQSAHSRPAEVV
ncbi:VWA domain-containing protein [Roseiconus nitratireducens]|uniref:VWA domain-containing protein n=1 Tax=Roseiconus nitratireducens TaxID=2605748 RepID=A0A5M6CX72_9BACT|nr:BatA domain-containing protein [Roseiconus nitratireducens]KAA5538990.1 VWA domain-containing protein [Roseiconus nitratireducens]